MFRRTFLKYLSLLAALFKCKGLSSENMLKDAGSLNPGPIHVLGVGGAAFILDGIFDKNASLNMDYTRFVSAEATGWVTHRYLTLGIRRGNDKNAPTRLTRSHERYDVYLLDVLRAVTLRAMLLIVAIDFDDSLSIDLFYQVRPFLTDHKGRIVFVIQLPHGAKKTDNKTCKNIISEMCRLSDTVIVNALGNETFRGAPSISVYELLGFRRKLTEVLTRLRFDM